MSNFFKVKPFQKEFKAIGNKETGISIVTYHNKLGKFTGSAQCAKEDEWSNFIGCHIAESRADIQYYKALIKYIRTQRNIIRAAYYQDMTPTLKGMLTHLNKQLIAAKKSLINEQIYLETYIREKTGQK